MKVVIKGLQNKEKEQGDAQTHDSDNIEFLQDFHIFYISYKKINILKNYGIPKSINQIKKRK